MKEFIQKIGIWFRTQSKLKIIIIILSILLFTCVLFKSTKNIENFFPFYKLNPKKYSSILFSSANKNNNCCLVTNKFNDKTKKFEYDYKKIKNCKLQDQHYSLNQNLFVHGEDDWDNKYCKKNNDYLGSCKIANFECKDFMSKKDCNKLSKTDMKWFKDTCHKPFKVPIEVKPYKVVLE